MLRMPERGWVNTPCGPEAAWASRDMAILARIMQVNYMGSVYCTYYALPHLKRSRGRIVGVSSLTGRTGVPTRSGYAASKHAMAGFFDSIRIELADDGVSVTMIYPGFVATGIRRRAYGPDGQPLGEVAGHDRGGGRRHTFHAR